MDRPTGSSRMRWSFWYMGLRTGPGAREQKYISLPYPSLPLLPSPVSLWLPSLSRTFHPSRGNTPLRLLALVPLQPKSLDPRASIGPGLHWVVSGNVVDFQYSQKYKKESTRFEREKKKNTAALSRHPVKNPPFLNPDAHMASDSCWAVKFRL